MLRACIVSLALFSGCVTPQVLPTVVVLPQSVAASDPSIRWYAIEGLTREALRAQLDHLGPLDAAGARHDAYTEWLVSWHFPFVETSQGCSVGLVSTTLRVTVLMPRWSASAETNELLIEQWRNYIDALWLHETGHRETAVRAAAEIAQRLPTLPQQATCAQAESLANEAAKAVLEEHRAAERAYDLETQHGAMQGATFPRSSL